MSDRVHLDVGSEIHPVGVGGFEIQVLHNLEGALAFVVEPPGWSCGTRVLGAEPYQFHGMEMWRCCPLLIGLVLVVLLGVDHSGPCELVNFSHF